MKTLICGVVAQDGSYLAKLLLEKDYEVVGTSQDAMITSFSSPERLEIHRDIQTSAHFDMDWQEHVRMEKDLFRASGLHTSSTNPSKAGKILGWSARTDVDGVIQAM